MSTDGMSLSFGSQAAAYERARPGYPPAAVEAGLPPGARTVVDLGAGTGKLTRALTARGLDVVAVEPDPGMRARLAAAVPGVRLLAGTAEALPLPDASADAVLVAQAWHWVDPVRAVPEIARGLRPGGRLALLWNIRDERVPWVGALGELLRRIAPTPTDTAMDEPVIGAPFGAPERHDVAWTHRLRRDGVLDLVTSRSYVIALPEAERAAVVDRVRDLLDDHPDLAGRDEVDLAYVCTAWWADLPSNPFS